MQYWLIYASAYQFYLHFTNVRNLFFFLEAILYFLTNMPGTCEHALECIQRKLCSLNL